MEFEFNKASDYSKKSKITITTLEELIALVEKEGEDIVIGKKLQAVKCEPGPNKDMIWRLTVYDGYLD